MPKKPGSHHVVLNADGGWDVKKDGAARSSGHFGKKRVAVDAGRKISQSQEPRHRILHPRQRTGRSRLRTVKGMIRIRLRDDFQSDSGYALVFNGQPPDPGVTP